MILACSVPTGGHGAPGDDELAGLANHNRARKLLADDDNLRVRNARVLVGHEDHKSREVVPGRRKYLAHCVRRGVYDLERDGAEFDCPPSKRVP